MWICIHTWGLEDFLRACGASEWQVLCASHAPWPRWEFYQQGDHFKYNNLNSLCNLTEEFEVGGPEYLAYDTRRKELKCRAYWEVKDGSMALVIDRDGEDGRFKETRELNGQGQLLFKLEALKSGMEGCTWGRTFE